MEGVGKGKFCRQHAAEMVHVGDAAERARGNDGSGGGLAEDGVDCAVAGALCGARSSLRSGRVNTRRGGKRTPLVPEQPIEGAGSLSGEAEVALKVKLAVALPCSVGVVGKRSAPVDPSCSSIAGDSFMKNTTRRIAKRDHRNPPLVPGNPVFGGDSVVAGVKLECSTSGPPL